MRAIEALFDASTARILADRGIGAGSHCLEVGCGAGGVATWMAEQVGPTGHVLAVDLDTRYIDPSGFGNLEVRERDILADELPEGYFDIAHARAVIEHIPAREAAVERMIAALKPGGWLVIEDVDFGGAAAAALARYSYPASFTDLFERFFRAVEVVFAAAYADASHGPRLPGLLQEAGLKYVSGEIRTPIVQGGSEQWVRGTAEQLAPRIVETGLVSEDELQAVLAMMDDPESHYVPPLMVAAWGQRQP
jgi:SAM-dependent methyltransferase